LTTIPEADAAPRSASRYTRILRLVRRGILALILLAIVGMFVNYFYQKSQDRRHVDLSTPASAYPLRQFPDLGRRHLQLNETFDGYNSNPPTSGPHSPVPADWGIHSDPVPVEQLVHNMEHGGVVIQYNCEAATPLTPEQCSALQANIKRVASPILDKQKLVVVAPSPKIDQHIALTAWTFMDTFDAFDQARIESFLNIFIRRFNPEGF
jgi:hypothetical protein